MPCPSPTERVLPEILRVGPIFWCFGRVSGTVTHKNALKTACRSLFRPPPPAFGYRHATFCLKFCVTDYLQIVMLNEVKHLYADSSLMNAQNGRALRMTGCRSVINEVAEAYAKE